MADHSSIAPSSSSSAAAPSSRQLTHATLQHVELHHGLALHLHAASAKACADAALLAEQCNGVAEGIVRASALKKQAESASILAQRVLAGLQHTLSTTAAPPRSVGSPG